jgi:hypothetical protein
MATAARAWRTRDTLSSSHVLLLLAVASKFGFSSAAKYLLLDDRNVIETTATLKLGSVVKSQLNPMVVEERDYEMRIDNGQPTVWFDSELGKWRLWYSAFTSCMGPKATNPCCQNASQTCGSTSATTCAKRGSALLYAESTDGLHWEKPNLGVVKWPWPNGSTDNNMIMMDPHGNWPSHGGQTTGVYLDESATSKDERYKIVTGSNIRGTLAVSSDGLRWNRTKDLFDTYGRWDTPKNVVWDSVRSQWILYDRSSPTVSEAESGTLRVQSFTYSLTSDFMGEWAPTMPTGLNSSVDFQPDGLLVWPYEGIFLGLGNVFNPTQEAGRVPIGQVNTVLAWSADGRRWKWVSPNDSLIPLGKADEFDACGVFGAKQEPLRTASLMGDGDDLRLYYVGCNGPFFGSRGCGIGMATIMRDGFAGYTGGSVTTAPTLVGVNGTLRLTLDGGTTRTRGVRVGVVGSKELSLDRCEPIRGANVDVVVSWRGNGTAVAASGALGAFVHGAVQLEFDIPADARVFAYSM